jgi:PAS domain S-box-containing protein
MTLRKQTLALVCLAIIGLMIVLYATSRLVLLGGFARLEEEATHQEVQRALSALSQQLQELDTTVYDWAAWDDTYEFMWDHNPDYVSSNLLDDTFAALRLNLILLVSPSGEVTFGKAFDTSTEEELPVPESVLDHLTERGLLRPGEEISSGVNGLLTLPEGSMILASRPILTSADAGPMRGWLVMGRYLDAGEVELMARTTHLSLMTKPLDDRDLPADFEQAQLSISEETPIVVRPLSADSIAGYGVLNDIYGAPGLILRVDTPRTIYEQGQSSIAYLMGSLLVVGLVFGALVLYVLNRRVLHRVGQLSVGVDEIRSRGDPSARLSVTGDDELSDLAHEINRMLAAVEDAQAELKESDERFRRMAETITDGLTVIEEGKTVYLNNRACQIFGYPEDELSALDLVDLAAPNETQRVQSAMAEARRAGSVPDELEYWVVQKDGTRRCVANRYASSVSADGTSRHYVVSTDVTERRQAEDALRNHSNRLAEMVEESTMELQNAQEELTRMEKLALLGELAGGVSHELRNPLAVISNAVYFLRSLLSDADDTVAEYLEMISMEIQRATKIVSDLLDFSRAKPAERVETPVMELVSEVVHRKRPPDGIVVKTEIPPDLPDIVVDPQQLGLVLANLVANAFEAMPGGGTLSIGATRDHDDVLLYVTDTGQGIAPQDLPKIFEPLYTTKPHGIGLGLSLCRSLLDANQGGINVQSTVGGGSTFTVVLPTTEAEF